MSACQLHLQDKLATLMQPCVAVVISTPCALSIVQMVYRGQYKC